MEVIRDSLVRLILDNWHLGVLAFAAVFLLGVLLGLLRRLTIALFNASVRSGEAVVAAVFSSFGRLAGLPFGGPAADADGAGDPPAPGPRLGGLAVIGFMLFISGWLIGAGMASKPGQVVSPSQAVAGETPVAKGGVIENAPAASAFGGLGKSSIP